MKEEGFVDMGLIKSFSVILPLFSHSTAYVPSIWSLTWLVPPLPVPPMYPHHEVHAVVFGVISVAVEVLHQPPLRVVLVVARALEARVGATGHALAAHLLNDLNHLGHGPGRGGGGGKEGGGRWSIVVIISRSSPSDLDPYQT